MPPVPAKKRVEIRPPTAIAAATEARKILYPQVKVKICEGKDALTHEQAKSLLRWETEDEYVARRLAEDPNLKPETLKFGDDFLLRDSQDRKVRCWNNSNNRPFSEEWARQLAQDILNREWQFNLETIIISKTGVVHSGQHRLIGLVLAYEQWAGVDKHHWEEKWERAPVIEVLVAYGGSDNPRTIGTLDNVKPRSLSDVFYTSELFQTLSPRDRKECSRMMDNAVKFLWRRTGAKQGYDKYLSHSMSIDFLSRHQTLLKCVKHIFDENKDRGISALGFSSPGRCATILYLMASCGSDREDYEVGQPRNEEKLDWHYLEQAKKFWSMITKDTGPLKPVRDALKGLVNKDTGAKPTEPEQWAVIAKAWSVIVDEGKLVAEQLRPIYTKDRDGIAHLNDFPTVGGIDLGEKPDGEGDAGDDPTPEEIAERAAQERARRAEELDAKAKAAKKPGASKPVQAATGKAHQQLKQKQLNALANNGEAKF